MSSPDNSAQCTSALEVALDVLDRQRDLYDLSLLLGNDTAKRQAVFAMKTTCAFIDSLGCQPPPERKKPKDGL